ncbi:MAG: hydrogenase expression/formation protein HypE [Verrucomicrobiales bacterium]|nr:hydrogenase expression/formation protein HypE [Verrucomicrobiales bacterium]
MAPELVQPSGECPLPISQYPHVVMAHGGGGKLMHELIEKVFLHAFTNPALDARHDAAVLNLGGTRLAFTTDSYVVNPLFFPGGDIGALAVHGTVNDLAMCGARPLWLSAGFILEEGLGLDVLRRIVQSMQRAARACGVEIVTGDTKVVDRGKADGLFINTAGIGLIQHGFELGPRRIAPGDAVIINGDIGRHGMAIMAVREGLRFETAIESDSAPLAEPVLKLLGAGIELHCLRDLTRGGLASALNELALAAAVEITIDERAVPVSEPVKAACEVLGLDPLSVACEGRFVAFVPGPEAARAVALLKSDALGAGAAVIGHVTAGQRARVVVRSAIGVDRVLDMPSGEQLPRIC